MKSKLWLLLFVADAILFICSDYFKCNAIRIATKPLLTIFLILYCCFEADKKNTIFFLLLFALFFSCLGDIFLLFENKNPNWFIFSLSSFLIAHIFYISLFIQIKKINQPHKKLNLSVSVIVSAYTVCLFLLLKPALGDLKIPVLIYAAALSVMLIASLHSFDLSNQTAGRLCAAGALLFLTSDSLLAINKFYAPVAKADFLIMSTYASAQLLIVLGITRFSKYANNN
jgi:uncharacterized membrane protein YhhN